MEDILEKVTINIDSRYGTFINDSEFYVDILDDIKNVIYIKTLKTEIFAYPNGTYNSELDGTSVKYLNKGDYIYVTLNNYNRINTISNEITPIKDSSGSLQYNSGGSVERDLFNRPINIKSTNSINILKYYDNIYINDGIPMDEGTGVENKDYIIYKQELTGTSCGPNDTNTVILNPILPELKRFTIKLYKTNEFGEHEPIAINNDGVYRVKVSFTIYYKRKKITRV